MFDSFSDKMDTEMIKELGEFKVDLDGRFSSVRTRETNLGNCCNEQILTLFYEVLKRLLPVILCQRLPD